MGYMTFGQQVAQHLQFLQKAGLELANLTIDSAEFIRSLSIGERGRGEYAYKTVSRRLNNGMVGLMTWCRSENGHINTYKTYGYPSTPDSNWKGGFSFAHSQGTCQPIIEEKTCCDVNLEKTQKFWEFSSQHGESDYLQRKGVGAYRIRFRENQYGKVAVVPMRDVQDRLRGCQILNSNGSKVFAKGMRLPGLFHRLTELVDGTPIGIAEGYVTAATCLELVDIPMVSAFTSDNLEQVATALQRRYPNSGIVIFADNDRHLSENKGLESANRALSRFKSRGVVLAPYFDEYPATRDYSDWNDLVREIGRKSTLKQIQEILTLTQNEGIRRWSIARCNKGVES